MTASQKAAYSSHKSPADLISAIQVKKVRLLSPLAAKHTLKYVQNDWSLLCLPSFACEQGFLLGTTMITLAQEEIPI